MAPNTDMSFPEQMYTQFQLTSPRNGKIDHCSPEEIFRSQSAALTNQEHGVPEGNGLMRAQSLEPQCYHDLVPWKPPAFELHEPQGYLISHQDESLRKSPFSLTSTASGRSLIQTPSSSNSFRDWSLIGHGTNGSNTSPTSTSELPLDLRLPATEPIHTIDFDAQTPVSLMGCSGGTDLLLPNVLLNGPLTKHGEISSDPDTMSTLRHFNSACLPSCR